MDELDDEFFEKLNETISTWLYSSTCKIYEEELSKIVCLAHVIIDNTPYLDEDDKEHEEEHVDINDSINLVIEFFNSINPEYAYRMQNIINLEKDTFNGKEDFSVRFHRFINKGKSSFVKGDGEVHISYNNTIGDAFSILHEMTHKFSSPYFQNNLIKDFLGETSSIEMEFLFYEYLMSKGLFIKDINSIMINRFFRIYEKAFKVIFEYTLIRLYRENNGCLNKQILLDYLNTMDKKSKLYNLFYLNGIRFLKNIVKDNKLHFNISQRYVIGMILTSDFYSRKKQGENVLNELFKLIEIFGKGYSVESDIKEIKKFIPIIDIDGFNISDSLLDRLITSYISVLEEFLNNQEDLESNHKL